MWSSYVFMCSLPVKTHNRRRISHQPSCYLILFFIVISIHLRLCLYCLFFPLCHTVCAGQGKGNAGRVLLFFLSPYLRALLTKELSSSRSCVTEGKKNTTVPPPAFHSPYCRSNRFSFSESDCGWTHSIGLNVYGLHFPPPHFRNLKTTKNKRQLFNLSRVTLKALYIYL